jgi:hypothetical protein
VRHPFSENDSISGLALVCRVVEYLGMGRLPNCPAQPMVSDLADLALTPQHLGMKSSLIA